MASGFDQMIQKLIFNCVILIACGSVHAQDAYIRVNQAGYQPADIKKAVVFSKEPLFGFFGAEDLGTGRPMLLRMPLRPTVSSPWGGEFAHYYELDFSSMRTPGRYRLRLEASGVTSREISIGIYPGYHEDLCSSCVNSGADTTRSWTWLAIGAMGGHFTLRFRTRLLSMRAAAGTMLAIS